MINFSSRGWWLPSRHPRVLTLVALALAACAGTTPPSPLAPPVETSCGPTSPTASVQIEAHEINSGLPQSGQWRNSFELVDFNGDHHLDLVQGPPRKGTKHPYIFLGDGLGHFTRWSDVHFPPAPLEYGGVAVADLNHDGLPDLVLGSHLLGITAMVRDTPTSFVSRSDGLPFRPPGQAPQPADFTATAIALTDWNRDGSLDIVALSEGPSRFTPIARGGFAIFLNRGGAWERIGQSDSTFGTSIAIGDVDGDGFPDAVLSSSSAGDRNLLRLGRGNDGWVSRDLPDIGDETFVTTVATMNVPGQQRSRILAAQKTPAGSHWCEALDLMEWQNGSLASKRLWSAPTDDQIVSIAIADLNHDRYPDLVLLRRDGSIVLLTGTANDQFSLAGEIARPARYQGCDGFHVAAGDLAGDTRSEIVASYAGEQQTVDPSSRCTSGGFAEWSVEPPQK